MRLGRIVGRQGQSLFNAFDQAVGANATQFRSRITAVIGEGQVLQLFGQYAADLQPRARQVARHDADAALALQRQQGAIAQEAQQLRILGHFAHRCERRAQDEAAKGFQAARHAHVDEASRRCAVFEAVRLNVLAFGRHRRGRHRLGQFQDRFVHVRIVPAVVAALLIRFQLRIFYRQQPDLCCPSDLGILHRIVELEHQHLLRFEALVVHQRGGRRIDADAV